MSTEAEKPDETSEQKAVRMAAAQAAVVASEKTHLRVDSRIQTLADEYLNLAGSAENSE